MQRFEFLRQPLMGELAMSPEREREREREREKNAICSGHLRLCQQPRAAHALRSDQDNQLPMLPRIKLGLSYILIKLRSSSMFKKIEVAMDMTFELMPTISTRLPLPAEKDCLGWRTRAYKIIRCNNCQSSPDS